MRRKPHSASDQGRGGRSQRHRGKIIAEHVETAKTHAKVADEHLDAASRAWMMLSNPAAEACDLAKKSAEEAVTHLKAAQ